MIAALAYPASGRIAHSANVPLSREALRFFPLLVAAVLGSAVVSTIRNLNRSNSRKAELARVNSELQTKVESAHESDAQFRLMFDGNPQPTYVYDCENLQLLDLNPATARKFGYTRDEFLQLTVPQIRQGIDPAGLALEVRGRQSGFNHAGVWQQRRKDGTVFAAEATVLRVALDGRDHELVLVADVGERIEAEEALRESKASLHSLVDRAPFGICRTSLVKNRLVSANPALCEILGYSEQELLKVSLSKDLCAPTVNWLELVDLLRRDRKLRAQEIVVQRKDGSQIRVRLTAFLTSGTGEEMDQVEAYIEDLTEQSALEQQIRAVQKLEAVGRLAGGVAHDFNNILLVIKLSTDMMLAQITPESSLARLALQVSNAADRAAALTRQMLAFSRRQMLQIRVVNINSVVNDISHLLHRIIGEDVRLVIKTADNLANARLDPDQLGQVVLNLAVNARDAMPGGGTLVIETENVVLDEAYAQSHPPVQPGRYVLVAVTDTGTGISKSDLPHIFDPFFTTKDVGKGTGLGLSIVYGIVKQSGGYIWVYSEPGQGTSFKLYFPTTDAAVEAFPQRSNIAGQAASQSILVVEDEAAIRANVRDCLRQLGYEVLEAESGEAALQICEQSKKKIDLVITDVIMPGIGGQELAQRLAKRLPGRLSTVHLWIHGRQRGPAGTAAGRKLFPGETIQRG